MRIVMNMMWEGPTKEQYESLRKTVNWEGDVPKGAVFHVAAFSSTAIYVTDVWESEEDFNNFIKTRLMPEVQKLGITSQPRIVINPLHAMFTPGV